MEGNSRVLGRDSEAGMAGRHWVWGRWQGAVWGRPGCPGPLDSAAPLYQLCGLQIFFSFWAVFSPYQWFRFLVRSLSFHGDPLLTGFVLCAWVSCPVVAGTTAWGNVPCVFFWGPYTCSFDLFWVTLCGQCEKTSSPLCTCGYPAWFLEDTVPNPLSILKRDGGFLPVMRMLGRCSH